MAERASTGVWPGETVPRPAEVAVRHCLIGSIAGAKIAGTQIACTQIAGAKIVCGESVGTAATAMEAWRAAHPDAAAVRRSRVKTAARMEAATTHAHAATTTVEAATTATHVEAANATTAAAMEAATTTAAAMETATTTATVSAATTATTAAATGGRRIGRQGGNHGHARQKCEGKLVLHVTPVSKSAPVSLTHKERIYQKHLSKTKTMGR